ncbi:MAG: tetratricopeptide repeat protein [Chloroflexi bacterium]|nr:tetratricopeptide repeat protein [Chloroflexota bacterium]
MSKSTQEQIAELKQAIDAQENMRPTLGDAVVDATLAALRSSLAGLEAQVVRSAQQRKQVTVLMADVSGFTAMSETMDAEEVTDVMNALWQGLDGAIVAHGGMIDKHIGDAVMALWGADDAREDDPENAIRAALDMQAALTQFPEDHNATLKMRIGINTGPVLLGTIGSTDEFTAMGDTVNLASRLEYAAPVDGVLISHDTYRHVRGVFDVQAQKPITVKGKAEPVQTYVVLRAKPRTFRVSTRGVEGIETRMIGRDAELRALQNAYQTAIDETTTTVVMIVGDAGVGKSRLLYEFDNWIELRPEDIWYFKGRTTPQMQNTAYSLIRDIFRNRFNILESDSVATVLEKFRTSMQNVLDAERADLVGHMIGFDFSTSQTVANLLGSSSFGKLATAYLTNYFRALTSEPTVMFLEDLHWIDDSSLSLLNHLLNEIPSGKLLVVCLTRPEFFERHPAWGESHNRLDLKPLTADASRALVNEVLQKMLVIPDDLRQLIVKGAEGNPFYVEELVKMLIDDGIIQRGHDEWQVEMKQLTELRVPPTLIGVLQARLDSLPPAEKATLQRASVVGRLFWDAVVAELADNHDVTSQIDQLHSRELIFPRGQSAFSGAQEYIFKHAILRDVAYETVLLKLRRAYHAQVASWLEQHTGDRVSEYLTLIAGHYELADENARAADYYYRAGDALHRVSDFRGALTAFERAFALVPEEDPVLRAQLLVGIGKTHNDLSDYSAATSYLTQGLELAHQSLDHAIEVQALNKLCIVLKRIGDYEEAESHVERALALAHSSEDRTGIADSLNNLGNVASDRGEYEVARHHYEESLAIRIAISDQPGVAATLNNLGIIAMMQGDYEASRRYKEESLAIRIAISDRSGVAATLGNLGNSAMMQGDYEAARRYHEESLAIWREIGDRAGTATGLNNLGVVAEHQGDFEAACCYHEDSLTIRKEIGDRAGAAMSLDNLGHVISSHGSATIAHGYYLDALRESTAAGFTPITLDSLAGVARLMTNGGHYERAVGILGLVIIHPSTPSETKQDIIEPTLAQLRELMPVDELEVALEHSKTLDLDEVVAEILADEGAP